MRLPVLLAAPVAAAALAAAPMAYASESGVAAGVTPYALPGGPAYVVTTQLEWHPSGIGYNGLALCETSAAGVAEIVLRCDLYSDGGISWSTEVSGPGPYAAAPVPWGSGEIPSKVCAVVSVAGRTPTQSCTQVYVP